MSQLIAPARWKAILLPEDGSNNLTTFDIPVVQFSKAKGSNIYVKCPIGSMPRLQVLTKDTRTWNDCRKTSKYHLKGLVPSYLPADKIQLLKLIEDYSNFKWFLHLLAYRPSWSKIAIEDYRANYNILATCSEFTRNYKSFCLFTKRLIDEAQRYYVATVSIATMGSMDPLKYFKRTFLDSVN